MMEEKIVTNLNPENKINNDDAVVASFELH